MAVKDIVVWDLTTASVVITLVADFVAFTPLWVYGLDDATDRRQAYPLTTQFVQKITVSPAGIPYPGDFVDGNGAKKVSINLGYPLTSSPLASVIMNHVEDVDLDNGWCVITKGDHLIAYSPLVIINLFIEPS